MAAQSRPPRTVRTIGANAIRVRSQCRTPRHLPLSMLLSLEKNLPLSVRDAAVYLGVSPQTVYLWVERKQIPHLRVMGRNIRFLKSELEPFRAQFKQEIGNGKT